MGNLETSHEGIEILPSDECQMKRFLVEKTATVEQVHGTGRRLKAFNAAFDGA
jgi:hypothetical protein